jgi:peptidoglycan/LPS O-acetylase OafA/YrhL
MQYCTCPYRKSPLNPNWLRPIIHCQANPTTPQQLHPLPVLIDSRSGDPSYSIFLLHLRCFVIFLYQTVCYLLRAFTFSSYFASSLWTTMSTVLRQTEQSTVPMPSHCFPMKLPARLQSAFRPKPKLPIVGQ